MILKLEDIPEHERHLIAFSSSHHVKKVDVLEEKAAPGRWVLDAKQLNTQHYKDAAIKRYGKVVYPTLQSIIAKWYQHASKQAVQFRDCRCTKDDVEGAFRQFPFSPEAAMI